MTDAEFQMFEEARLEVYVRPTEGTLALGNLAPGDTHVSPLPVAPDQMTALYLGNGHPIGLRCLRSIPGQ